MTSVPILAVHQILSFEAPRPQENRVMQRSYIPPILCFIMLTHLHGKSTPQCQTLSKSDFSAENNPWRLPNHVVNFEWF